MEKISTGFTFTEGPVWSKEEGCLFFSDIPENKIWRWTEDEGKEIYREPSGKSNGLTLDEEGRLLACEHANRRVSRTEEDGSVTSLVETYEGKRLNSPNDLVVASDGTIYFTDPPYGLEGQDGGYRDKELPFQGLYRLESEEGELTLLAKDFEKPNGLAFSPDESLLYVDDTDRGHVRKFPVNEDGTLGKGDLFVQLKGKREGNVDGMKVDEEGNVYVTGPGGIWVFAPDGKGLGRIEVPEVAANLAWGEEGKTLFITASTSLYRIKLEVEGISAS